mmetsp:Transcript_6959/g.28505  ORF Transcript_6959/g.28505 Transcript_6959/m.28505 type:complete len:230 (-) Transcript_6959:2373-3062(-)
MHASPTHAATTSSLLRAQARPMRARASTWLLRASSRTPTQAPAHERAQHAWTRTRAWRRTVPCVRRSCARMASASYAFMQTLRQPNSGRREPRQSLLGPTRVRVVRAGRASRSRTGAQPRRWRRRVASRRMSARWRPHGRRYSCLQRAGTQTWRARAQFSRVIPRADGCSASTTTTAATRARVLLERRRLGGPPLARRCYMRRESTMPLSAALLCPRASITSAPRRATP